MLAGVAAGGAGGLAVTACRRGRRSSPLLLAGAILAYDGGMKRTSAGAGGHGVVPLPQRAARAPIVGAPIAAGGASGVRRRAVHRRRDVVRRAPRRTPARGPC